MSDGARMDDILGQALAKDAVFYRTNSLLYRKFGNTVTFRSGNLYSLCSPWNQDYEKIIHFFHQKWSKSRMQSRISTLFDEKN